MTVNGVCVWETGPCLIVNDAALVLVLRMKRVSKRMSWEEVAYTPVAICQSISCLVAASFESRPTPAFTEWPWSPALIPS